MSAQPTTTRNNWKLVILVSAALLLVGLAWYVNNRISFAQLADQLRQPFFRFRALSVCVGCAGLNRDLGSVPMPA